MKKVFVIGSLNMDLVVITKDFPRPGETVLGNEFFSNSGGKGANQAVASAKQGAETFHMGAIGNDIFGDQLVESMKGYGVCCDLIHRKDGPTGIAMIILNNGENRIIVSPGANFKYTIEEVFEGLKTFSKPGDIVVLQLEIEKHVVEKVIPIAKSMGLIVIFNPAPMVAGLDMNVIKYVDVLIMNEWEAKTMLKMEDKTFNTKHLVDKLKTFGSKDVIITLGEKGGIYLHNGQVYEYSAFQSKVVDTTGAGDSFVGTIASCLAEDMPICEAIKRASYVASITISRPGAQQAIPYKKEVDEMFKEAHSNHAR